MEILVQFENGVFKPLQEITGVEEGEQFEVHLERADWHKLAMKNKSFDFLREEPEIYSEYDIKEKS